MSTFLQRLISRHLQQVEVIKPRVPTLFEPTEPELQPTTAIKTQGPGKENRPAANRSEQSLPSIPGPTEESERKPDKAVRQQQEHAAPTRSPMPVRPQAAVRVPRLVGEETAPERVAGQQSTQPAPRPTSITRAVAQSVNGSTHDRAERGGYPQAARNVQVSIGRVEIRAVVEAPGARRTAPSQAPRVTLEQYLRSKASEGGG